MRILALEPYYGGSHQAFLDGWISASRHRWTLLTLPAFHWKWRMRHGAVTLAAEVADRVAAGESWDLVFCSDMLDLATFRGLAPTAVNALPSIVYFHENQLTYPTRFETERDLHFGLTHLTTTLAADKVWFNSAFHRDELLAALPGMLRRMPDHQPFDAVERLRSRARVLPPGIEPMPVRGPRPAGPLRILWAARWEHDKGPETFFEGLEIARRSGVPFRVSVVGEQFRRVPEVFAAASRSFDGLIDHWGFQRSRDDYRQVLLACDVIVSTALHEFFGVGVAEAVAAGCYPLLPERLAYPELLAGVDGERRPDFFYDGTARGLADRLAELAVRQAAGDLWNGDPECAKRAVARFAWTTRAPRLDEAAEVAAG